MVHIKYPSIQDISFSPSSSHLRPVRVQLAKIGHLRLSGADSVGRIRCVVEKEKGSADISSARPELHLHLGSENLFKKYRYEVAIAF